MPTYTLVKRNRVGAQLEGIVDVTFDSSYPTGGELFSPADIDPTAGANASFHFVNINVNDATIADNRIVQYDYANKKLQVFTAINTEAGNASNQSAVTARALVRWGGL